MPDCPTRLRQHTLVADAVANKLIGNGHRVAASAANAAYTKIMLRPLREIEQEVAEAHGASSVQQSTAPRNVL